MPTVGDARAEPTDRRNDARRIRGVKAKKTTSVDDGDTGVTGPRESGPVTRSSDRTGLLIVRLWVEHDSRVGFRARITQSLDSSSVEQAMTMAVSPEDVYAVVQAWVEAFVASGSASGVGTRLRWDTDRSVTPA